MFRGVELILVTRQETIVLLKAEPTIAKNVPLVVRVRYSEPKFN
jgi:hypothetical protein